jgi:hypothetical protein
MNSSGRSLLAFATKQPPMSWMDHGDGKSLVLIIDDPDAPDPKAPKGALGTLGRLQHAGRYQKLARERRQGTIARYLGSMISKRPGMAACVRRSVGIVTSINSRRSISRSI